MSAIEGADTANLVALVTIDFDPESETLELQFHEIADRVPVDRASVAHYPRGLADMLEARDAELGATP